MNSNVIFPNLWRFIGLIMAQALVFRQVALSAGEYFNVLLYPLFILFLPLQLATPYAVLLGCSAGFLVDVFYGSWGIHASAGAFAGFIRALILAGFEPKGGFSGKEVIASPAVFGWRWFMQVSALFFFAYLLWYFSVDAFTFVYFARILTKTLAAWILTMIFVIFYGFLFNPKQ